MASTDIGNNTLHIPQTWAITQCTSHMNSLHTTDW